jgi:hypothetical protein
MDESAAVSWDGSLEGLFMILDGAYRNGTMPGSPCLTPPDGGVTPGGAGPPGETAGGMAQPELFPDAALRPAAAPRPYRGGNRGAGRREFPPEGRLFSAGGSAALFPDLRGSVSAALLLELSADAFDALVSAWMSELPVEGEILRFGWKVLAAAGAVPAAGPFPPDRAAGASPVSGISGAARDTAAVPAAGAIPVPGISGAAGDTGAVPAAVQGAPVTDAAVFPAAALSRAACPEARREAARAASDRGDPDVRIVLEAAWKVGCEIDRLRGLLRFAPVSGGNDGCFGGGKDGLYLARCSPDHYVLPALAGHFTRRFGPRGWAIVDEKRGLALLRRPGGDPALVPAELFGPPGPAADGCEELWRHDHKTINTESRNNPALQRRCMPKRYWNYLPELR